MSKEHMFQSIVPTASSTDWRRVQRNSGIALGIFVVVAVLVAGLALSEKSLPFLLRSPESTALQAGGVATLLLRADIAEVRRMPDDRMYVVMTDGAESREVCLSNGHTSPGPLGDCESRSWQGWKSLPEDFSYRIVGTQNVQYRGDEAPQDMGKADFVKAVVWELRTAQVLAQEVAQDEQEKARVKESWSTK